MHITKKILFSYVFICIFNTIQAQNEPYPVHDTKAVIIQDPYLIDPSETGMTISWLTDTPSQSKVMYGRKGEKLTGVAEMQEHGLVPVDTKHSIRLKDLEPGVTYNYKVLSRRVVKLNPYWPDMGQWVESPVYSFTTFDRKKSKVSFSSISDTHENVNRIQKFMAIVDWENTDFFVQTGDAFDWLGNEDQIFTKWLSPIAKGLDQKTPLIYARGNHELRGSIARNLFDYLPIEGGEFYFARNDGPAHFVVIDSGEDKADSTNVYAGLNRLKEYREVEFKWFENHVETSQSLKEASFRILFMHDPEWGWVDGENDKWTQLANKANIDLVIAGHWHKFKRFNPKEEGINEYPILILGQKEIAHVEVTNEHITVEVRDIENVVVDSFRVNKKGAIEELKK